MPTYEYECQHCGHAFERFQNMTDKPLQRCPKCRHKIKRLAGRGSGIIFKGSGFYETDYRSESYKRKASEDKTPGVEPKKESTTATESGKQAGKKNRPA